MNTVKALIGRKVGMTQIFNEEGNVQRITIIETTPNVVTQVKTVENDGYSAIQLGFGEAKKPAKPQAGHMKASGAMSQVLREIRVEEAGDLNVGTKLAADTFELGDSVQITGTSKGKGFAGTIKRHNFHRGPKTHGSHNYRAPGSIGAGYPQHVFKGKKMAGRMGGDQVTVKGAKIALVDVERNLIGITGAVPGPRKGIVIVRTA
jgi:large subunit ribosomal protein L3